MRPPGGGAARRGGSGRDRVLGVRPPHHTVADRRSTTWRPTDQYAELHAEIARQRGDPDFERDIAKTARAFGPPPRPRRGGRFRLLHGAACRRPAARAGDPARRRRADGPASKAVDAPVPGSEEAPPGDSRRPAVAAQGPRHPPPPPPQFPAPPPTSRAGRKSLLYPLALRARVNRHIGPGRGPQGRRAPGAPESPDIASRVVVLRPLEPYASDAGRVPSVTGTLRRRRRGWRTACGWTQPPL